MVKENVLSYINNPRPKKCKKKLKSDNYVCNKQLNTNTLLRVNNLDLRLTRCFMQIAHPLISNILFSKDNIKNVLKNDYMNKSCIEI